MSLRLKYYVDQDADDVADELWKAHAGLGNTGNTPPKSAEKAEKGSADESTEALS
jgi:hypothetical protein